jgi:hypothetical protein
LLYLIMAWILEHKHYFKFQAKRKQSIWDLWNYWSPEVMAFWAKNLSIYVCRSKSISLRPQVEPTVILFALAIGTKR